MREGCKETSFAQRWLCGRSLVVRERLSQRFEVSCVRRFRNRKNTRWLASSGDPLGPLFGSEWASWQKMGPKRRMGPKLDLFFTVCAAFWEDLQIANRCDRLIDDGADVTLWIRKGSQFEGPFDSMLYTKAPFGGAVCCRITQGGTTPIDVVKTRMQLERNQRNTRVSSALARALSPPRARVPCSRV